MHAFILATTRDGFLLALRVTGKWIRVAYRPSENERQALEASRGRMVHAIVRGEVVVAVYS